MNKNVGTILPTDKAISLAVIEPFHFADHASFLQKIFVHSAQAMVRQGIRAVVPTQRKMNCAFL
jgi:hypothetical protein